MNKNDFHIIATIVICVLLLLTAISAKAENRALTDILNAYARQPLVIVVQPNNFVPNPPLFLPPVRGQVLDQADFGGARLHETQPINLLGNNDE
jgi:hypothetical protein